MVRAELPAWEHVDLERARDAAIIAVDIEAWLRGHPRRVVIDEAQRLPELFPALRVALDEKRRNGRVVLLGSASPTLMRRVSESLAGRVGRVEMTPFVGRELYGTRRAADRWFWGGFPPVHARRSADARGAWLDNWLASALERDLPALGIALPPPRLRKLAEMLTHVHGNLLNMSDLARSLGVTHPTIAGDLDALEGLFIVRRLQPYFANVQKRLTKSPKLYLRDTGLLHFLAGLRRPNELESWARLGASFEGLVIEEIAALADERIVRPGLFFWRTEAGGEVDLLVVDGRRIVPIEIKLSAVIDGRSLRSLRECMSDLGVARGFVVTGGGKRERLGAVEIIPFAEILSGAFDFGFGRSYSARGPVAQR